MRCKLIEVMFMLLIAGALVIAGCTSTQPGHTPSDTIAVTGTPVPSGGSVLVYSGAGLKTPMQELGQSFTKKYGRLWFSLTGNLKMHGRNDPITGLSAG